MQIVMKHNESMTHVYRGGRLRRVLVKKEWTNKRINEQRNKDSGRVGLKTGILRSIGSIHVCPSTSLGAGRTSRAKEKDQSVENKL
jgi:hypothetical protein